jgi:hypothetical protein
MIIRDIACPGLVSAYTVDDGYLKNLEDRKGRPARLVLGDDLPEDQPILPDPEELQVSGFTVSGFREGYEAPLPPL